MAAVWIRPSHTAISVSSVNDPQWALGVRHDAAGHSPSSPAEQWVLVDADDELIDGLRQAHQFIDRLPGEHTSMTRQLRVGADNWIGDLGQTLIKFADKSGTV